ncbi:MAG: hypothetical protein R6W66_07400, partial [Pelovirga sp.]
MPLLHAPAVGGDPVVEMPAAVLQCQLSRTRLTDHHAVLQFERLFDQPGALNIPDSKDGIQLFIKTITSIWEASLSVVGSITLIFALIQHFSPGEQETITEDWSLKSIEKAPEKHQKVSIVELIIESIFICLFLVVLNQATPVLAISFPENKVIPILDMVLFKPFLIWINITLISNLILNFYLLIKREWQTVTRIIAIAIDVITVGIFTKL